jgi:hypothetical protein
MSFSLTKRARWFHLALLLGSLASVDLTAHAQTISPVRSEYRVEANGEFQVVNNTFKPITVVFEVQSFNVSETGEITYGPLDPSIHVKLAATSVRLQAKQSYSVAYKAKADKLPGWFVIYAKFTDLPVRTSSGMNVSINLPHTVYVLPKKDADRSELKVVRAEFDPSAKKVFVEMQSHSERFARVLTTRLVAGKKMVDGPGFPMYPGGTRKMEIGWSDNEQPTRATLVFENYKIEVPIQQSR